MHQQNSFSLCVNVFGLEAKMRVIPAPSGDNVITQNLNQKDEITTSSSKISDLIRNYEMISEKNVKVNGRDDATDDMSIRSGRSSISGRSAQSVPIQRTAAPSASSSPMIPKSTLSSSKIKSIIINDSTGNDTPTQVVKMDSKDTAMAASSVAPKSTLSSSPRIKSIIINGSTGNHTPTQVLKMDSNDATMTASPVAPKLTISSSSRIKSFVIIDSTKSGAPTHVERVKSEESTSGTSLKSPLSTISTAITKDLDSSSSGSINGKATMSKEAMLSINTTEEKNKEERTREDEQSQVQKPVPNLHDTQRAISQSTERGYLNEEKANNQQMQMSSCEEEKCANAEVEIHPKQVIDEKHEGLNPEKSTIMSQGQKETPRSNGNKVPFDEPLKVKDDHIAVENFHRNPPREEQVVSVTESENCTESREICPEKAAREVNSERDTETTVVESAGEKVNSGQNFFGDLQKTLEKGFTWGLDPSFLNLMRAEESSSERTLPEESGKSSKDTTTMGTVNRHGDVTAIPSSSDDKNKVPTDGEPGSHIVSCERKQQPDEGLSFARERNENEGYFGQNFLRNIENTLSDSAINIEGLLGSRATKPEAKCDDKSKTSIIEESKSKVSLSKEEKSKDLNASIIDKSKETEKEFKSEPLKEKVVKISKSSKEAYEKKPEQGGTPGDTAADSSASTKSVKHAHKQQPRVVVQQLKRDRITVDEFKGQDFGKYNVVQDSKYEEMFGKGATFNSENISTDLFENSKVEKAVSKNKMVSSRFQRYEARKKRLLKKYAKNKHPVIKPVESRKEDYSEHTPQWSKSFPTNESSISFDDSVSKKFILEEAVQKIEENYVNSSTSWKSPVNEFTNFTKKNNAKKRQTSIQKQDSFTQNDLLGIIPEIFADSPFSSSKTKTYQTEENTTDKSANTNGKETSKSAINPAPEKIAPKYSANEMSSCAWMYYY